MVTDLNRNVKHRWEDLHFAQRSATRVDRDRLMVRNDLVGLLDRCRGYLLPELRTGDPGGLGSV